jgi:hypothetical protein
MPRPDFSSQSQILAPRALSWLRAGAHSFSEPNGGLTRDAAVYVQSVAAELSVEQLESIAAAGPEEEPFLGLRQLAGVDLNRLQKFMASPWSTLHALEAPAYERDKRGSPQARTPQH